MNTYFKKKRVFWVFCRCEAFFCWAPGDGAGRQPLGEGLLGRVAHRPGQLRRPAAGALGPAELWALRPIGQEFRGTTDVTGWSFEFWFIFWVQFHSSFFWYLITVEYMWLNCGCLVMIFYFRNVTCGCKVHHWLFGCGLQTRESGAPSAVGWCLQRLRMIILPWQLLCGFYTQYVLQQIFKTTFLPMFRWGILSITEFGGLAMFSIRIASDRHGGLGMSANFNFGMWTKPWLTVNISHQDGMIQSHNYPVPLYSGSATSTELVALKLGPLNEDSLAKTYEDLGQSYERLNHREVQKSFSSSCGDRFRHRTGHHFDWLTTTGWFFGVFLGNSQMSTSSADICEKMQRRVVLFLDAFKHGFRWRSVGPCFSFPQTMLRRVSRNALGCEKVQCRVIYQAILEKWHQEPSRFGFSNQYCIWYFIFMISSFFWSQVKFRDSAWSTWKTGWSRPVRPRSSAQMAMRCWRVWSWRPWRSQGSRDPFQMVPKNMWWLVGWNFQVFEFVSDLDIIFSSFLRWIIFGTKGFSLNSQQRRWFASLPVPGFPIGLLYLALGGVFVWCGQLQSFDRRGTMLFFNLDDKTHLTQNGVYS